MKCCIIPLTSIGNLEIYFSSNGKIIKSRITTNNEHSNIVNDDSHSEKICEYLINGTISTDLLNLIEIPRGIKGLILLSIMAISKGYVASYSQLAKVVGTSPRVVGRIAALNKIPLLIPCHRVVKNSGKLGGYSVGGTEIKSKLLNSEGVKVMNGRVLRKYFIDYELLSKKTTELIVKLGSRKYLNINDK